MAAPSKTKTFAAEAELVKELTALFDASDLGEMEIETKDISVRLARQSTAPAMGAAMPAPPPVQAAPAAVPAPPPAASAPAADYDSHPGAVKSPMVGTVYLSPEPNAPVFVTEGQQVKKGQTLFIVEAMKVMNPITAPQDGTVSRILVDNAQPIEFDQPLAIID